MQIYIFILNIEFMKIHKNKYQIYHIFFEQ
jgi:hypothetical protein